VEKCLHKRLINKIYPLHEPEGLKRLSHDWLINSFKYATKQLPLSMLYNHF
jgi:hypothetical protein